MNVQNVCFIKSAASKEGFLRDDLPQVVFAGRSNVGKSSVLNRLLNRKKLARTSAVPGKTAQVNYFLLDGCAYLVDLPGYGYAKVSKEERQRWGRLMEDYFASPEAITLGVLLVDSRHAPTGDDLVMADWFRGAGRPFLVVANKLDKLKKNQVEGNIGLIREKLKLESEALIPFSAETGTGREALLAAVTAAAQTGKEDN